MTKLSLVLARAAAVACIATVGVAGTNALPLADAKVVIGVVSEQAIADIDGTRLATLTLQKAPHNPFDDPTEGQTPPSSLAGSVFTARLVNGVDLTTQAGWDTARSLDVAGARERGFGREFQATTDQDGIAKLEGLPVGLYLVEETPPDAENFPESAPFLITIPTGSTDGTTWVYDVKLTVKDQPTTTPPDTPVVPPTPVVPVIPVIPGEPGPTPTPRSSVPVTPPVTAPVPGAPVSPPATQWEKLREKYLPNTGADVLMVMAAGLAIAAAGLFLVLRNRRSREGR